MEQHKKDESVKTGLKIEGNTNTQQGQQINNNDASKEIDADELVHQQKEDENIVNIDEEQDLDELVHKLPVAKMHTDMHEIDPDDLVHQK